MTELDTKRDIIYYCEFCKGKVTTDRWGNLREGCCPAQTEKRWLDYQEKLKKEKRPYNRKKIMPRGTYWDGQRYIEPPDNPPTTGEKETKQ